MHRVAVACLVAGCSGAPPAVSPPTTTTDEVAPRPPPRADFVVVPAELADPGILDRIPHRVRLQTIGDSWLREDGAVTRRGSKIKANVVLPAIGETPDKVRVAFEDDKARLALWIAKRDTWPILAVPTVLADASGKAPRDAGVFAIRGAALHVEPSGAPFRRVRIDDPYVELEGHVAPSAIATVWIAGPGDAAPTLSTGSDAAWSPPAADPRVELAKGAAVRSAPEQHAPAIAVVKMAGVIAKRIGEHGAYVKIEMARRYARVVGFVLAHELTATPAITIGHGGGRGHGFGMSHAEQIEVPAGTCLFDELDGQVTGVQLETMTRLGSTRQAKPGWALVHVGTQWVTLRLYVKNLGDDPKQPKWESCTEPAVRK